jgi:hypothetical protein
MTAIRANIWVTSSITATENPGALPTSARPSGPISATDHYTSAKPAASSSTVIVAGVYILRRGFEVARRQHAKSWELCAATSLARLWQRQGKRRDAHDLLSPV